MAATGAAIGTATRAATRANASARAVVDLHEQPAGSSTRLLFWIGLMGLGLGSAGPISIGWLALGLVLLDTLAPGQSRRALGKLRLGLHKPIVTVAGTALELPLAVANASGAPTARDVLLGIGLARRRPARAGATLGWLAAGRSETLALATRFPARGHHQRLTVWLSSSFPFGLREVRAQVELPADILVLPRLVRLLRREELLGIGRQEERRSRRSRSGEGEFRALHEWRPGSSLRGVHWKLSARRGRRLVRELESQEDASLRVLLSTRVPLLPPSGQSPSFERAVSLAATLLEAGAARGWKVALELCDCGPSGRVAARRGRAVARELRARLAHVQARAGDPLAAAVAAWGARPRGEEQRVLILATGPDAALGTPVFGAQAVSFADFVIDVDAPESRAYFRQEGAHASRLARGHAR